MSDNEQKNETRETIDDIVFELREHDHEMIPPYLCFDEEGGVMIGALADRIEAAWARESKAIATEHAVLPAVCITKQQGNAAAMREALEPVLAVEGAIEQAKRADMKITCREDERLLQCLNAVAKAQEIMKSATERKGEGDGR